MSQFVHEAFHIHGVLVHINTAEKARSQMGVSHRVINQQIGNAIRDGMISRFIYTLELGWVFAVADRLRRECGQN